MIEANCLHRQIYGPPESESLRKHGGQQRLMGAVFIGIGLAFIIGGLASTADVMAPELYGDRITRWPAEAWGAVVAVSAALYRLGIAINGRWRWSPAIRTAGAAAQVSITLAIIVGCWGTPFGLPWALAAAPLCVAWVWCFWLALGDLSRAVWGYDDD
ncbi:hypothetical protein DSD19_06330 [Rhodovulum sp. BSW8]|uniref:hypothetical protein n=1 Tax=Rhodovulum sp. BSW8 TaxID=2259645 RepID=UPI000DE369A1|nr:hypothetical protein [Rhodovulum sp. BSW8]RBO54074.1 hypothetical protein DSD19_06330 [Rhodovulum sp. BSW8]